MNFDIVIPTYKRFDKLVTCLNSIPRLDNVRVWVYFDNSDLETYAQIDKLRLNVNKLMFSTKKQAFGIWNWHLKNCFRSDIFVYLCDDTELFPHTLINIEKHFKSKFPDTDGMVTFNQVNIKGSDSAMGCVGRKFVERYKDNQIFCPNYVSFYSDSELGEWAKNLGKFHYGVDCPINHFHPSFFNNADEAHWAIRGEDKTIDVKVHKIRKEKGLLWGKTYEQIERKL